MIARFKERLAQTVRQARCRLQANLMLNVETEPHFIYEGKVFAGVFVPVLGLSRIFSTLVKIHFISHISTVPITIDQIVEETRNLPNEVVAELIDRIMVARHGGVEPAIATAWKTETDRRILEIQSGNVKGVPLEESLARARKIASL